MLNIQSREEVTTSTKTLYTGIADLNIVAINPTEEQLATLSPNHRYKQNVVDTDANGNSRVRLDFYYTVNNAEQEPVIHDVFSIFLVNDHFVGSETGSNQHINSKAQTVWAKAGEAVQDAINRVNSKKEWFINDGKLRPALRGEAEMYEVLSDLFYVDNSNPDTELDLSEHYMDWFDGNFNFVNIFQTLETKYGKEVFHPIRRLLGVKNGQYQSVWHRQSINKNVLPNPTNKKDRFMKELTGTYGPDFDYQNSLAFKVYQPNLDVQAIENIPTNNVTEVPRNPFA